MEERDLLLELYEDGLALQMPREVARLVAAMGAEKPFPTFEEVRGWYRECREWRWATDVMRRGLDVKLLLRYVRGEAAPAGIGDIMNYRDNRLRDEELHAELLVYIAHSPLPRPQRAEAVREALAMQFPLNGRPSDVRVARGVRNVVSLEPAFVRRECMKILAATHWVIQDTPFVRNALCDAIRDAPKTKLMPATAPKGFVRR